MCCLKESWHLPHWWKLLRGADEGWANICGCGETTPTSGFFSLFNLTLFFILNKNHTLCWTTEYKRIRCTILDVYYLGEKGLQNIQNFTADSKHLNIRSILLNLMVGVRQQQLLCFWRDLRYSGRDRQGKCLCIIFLWHGLWQSHTERDVMQLFGATGTSRYSQADRVHFTGAHSCASKFSTIYPGT